VLDPLFDDLLSKNKSVEHIVGAYDVSPEEHIKMQATVQKYIDSAVSKTCNLPADFTPDTLYNELLTFASDIKGFTFYKAGSRGNEPLEALSLKDINLDKLRKDGKIEAQVEFVDSCKNGICEL